MVLKDGLINNPLIQVVVEGLSKESISVTGLAVLPAKDPNDKACSQGLLSVLPSSDLLQSGKYDRVNNFLVFRVVARPVRMKMCMYVGRKGFEYIFSVGLAPVMSRPSKILASEGRCSLSPRGDCSLNLTPDPTTIGAAVSLLNFALWVSECSAPFVDGESVS